MTTSFIDQPSQRKAASRTYMQSHWLLNPIADYLLACGGLVWLLFAIHFFFLRGTDAGATANALIVLSGAGALFLGEGHTAATLVRVYGNKPLHDQLPKAVRILPLVFAAIALAGSCIPAIALILVKLYMLVVPQHFMSQSYGIAKLYCLKRKYKLDDNEDWALKAVTRLTIAFAIIKQLTYKSWSGNTFLGQSIVFWGPLPEWIFLLVQSMLVVASAYFAFVCLKTYLVKKASIPLPALLTIATSVAAFTMGQEATGIYWLYVSAFFHATQYLIVTVLCRIEEVELDLQAQPINHSQTQTETQSRPESQTQSVIPAGPGLRFIGMALLVSVFLYIGLPRFLEHFGCNFLLASAAIFATINLHHAIIDSLIWKLRKSTVRKSLAI